MTEHYEGHRTGQWQRHQWPADKEDRLRVLWAEKATARAIGLELKVSRSAVIGKAHRMELPAHANPPRGRAAGAPSKPRQRPAGAPSNPVGMLDAFRAKANQRPPQPVLEAIDMVPETSPDARSLMELTDNTCRWPLGPEPATQTFCGSEPFPGLPYCSRHACLAYKPHSRPERNIR